MNEMPSVVQSGEMLCVNYPQIFTSHQILVESWILTHTNTHKTRRSELYRVAIAMRGIFYSYFETKQINLTECHFVVYLT